MSIVSIQNLGKSFREYRSEWHRFARWFGLPVKSHTETWVARHINFDIPEGEAVGIVGQNGAGKSTLLKMITGTLHPSEGAVQINGRISAILELGMGFNPDLSGRNNAVHSAGLMGFNATQIADSIDQIEEFAEIGEYFDQPVRTYSSGMQMRVAFSVATAWRPELLIVDEALAVGDTYFQHKCFQKIREFQDQGTSLLLVSHDRTSIQALCNRAILLEKGSVIKDGDPEEVFDFYNAIIAEKQSSTIRLAPQDDGRKQTTSGTGEAVIEEPALYNVKGNISDTFNVGDMIELRVKARVDSNIDGLIMGYMLKDRLGQTIFGTNTWHTGQAINEPSKGDLYQFRLVFPANLGVGSYSVALALHGSDTHIGSSYEWRDLALVFTVINSSKNTFVGTGWIEPQIEIVKL